MQSVSILITNDDGYGAEGLKALEESLAEIGTVWVIAPDREQSGQGHALTLNDPLRFHKRGPRHFVVQGTPTDCVYLGIHAILKAEGRPRLVVSGINRGYNLGDDITYSGTVSAAFEATLMSLPAFAISQEIRADSPVDFGAAGRFARVLAREILERGMPADTLFNVNVPRRPPRGVRVTHQGRRIYPGGVIERTDPKGRTYYWIGAQSADWEDDPKSDFAALGDGFVSVTPLHLDLTNYKVMDQLRRWNLEL
ncbi:MAG: 5'/3'-nucleotidase SurE [Acidobacteria bacterium 13_1_20CM_2_68_14]|nr:MAG: 5'/3'-nucleotidase SurE [Acidobacteria bacterium 13_1_20CM_2_68_14]